MRIAIIEDELPARQQLISLISKLRRGIEVVFEAASIKEAVNYLKPQPELDLIFLDIQLNDGLSLDIFKKVEVLCPVIFATAYDQYLLKAFQENSIDYLLKPIKQRELENALQKYDRLKNHFSPDIQSLTKMFQGGNATNFKSRLLVKKGIHFTSIATDDIHYFFSEHKVTFAVDTTGQKMMVDESLSDLESQLDPANFYRLNRKYLANLKGVDKFISNGKGKMIVYLTPEVREEVTVSQEKSSEFKNWMAGLS